MEDRLRLTRAGRRALKRGLDGISPGAQLLMEVLARTTNITVEHAEELVEQLLEKYGSPEEALTAVKFGVVQFELVESR